MKPSTILQGRCKGSDYDSAPSSTNDQDQDGGVDGRVTLDRQEDSDGGPTMNDGIGGQGTTTNVMNGDEEQQGTRDEANETTIQAVQGYCNPLQT
jgi:hypothetical protein